MMSDRIGAVELPFTQEDIANRISVRRAGVSVAASTLQAIQAISYHRGRIMITDRLAIERAACECYQVMAQDFQDLGEAPGNVASVTDRAVRFESKSGESIEPAAFLDSLSVTFSVKIMTPVALPSPLEAERRYEQTRAEGFAVRHVRPDRLRL
jgi:hypothetical protein